MSSKESIFPSSGVCEVISHVCYQADISVFSLKKKAQPRFKYRKSRLREQKKRSEKKKVEKNKIIIDREQGKAGRLAAEKKKKKKKNIKKLAAKQSHQRERKKKKKRKGTQKINRAGHSQVATHYNEAV